MKKILIILLMLLALLLLSQREDLYLLIQAERLNGRNLFLSSGMEMRMIFDDGFLNLPLDFENTNQRITQYLYLAGMRVFTLLAVLYKELCLNLVITGYLTYLYKAGISVYATTFKRTKIILHHLIRFILFILTVMLLQSFIPALAYLCVLAIILSLLLPVYTVLRF